MRILLAVILLVGAGMLALWWRAPEPIAQPVAPQTSQEAVPQAPPKLPPERASAPESPETLKLFQVSEFAGLHEKNISLVNKMLRRSGRPEIPPDAKATDEELGQLADMVTATSKAINDAADGVLSYQRPYAKKMSSVVKTAVDAGKELPYRVLPNGVLPDPKPYELFITTAYLGVVYLQTIPITAELMEIVDQQKIAEALRIDAFAGFAAKLKR
jgi:hypothetical protein